MGNNYILIVEDNKIDTLVHTKIIQIARPDLEIVHAENGKIALELLKERETKPSLVLLDLIMPVMDGFEFLDKLSAMPEYKDLKIIVLTTSTNQQDRKKSSSIFNITDYVIKPLTRERFRELAETMGI